MPSLFRNRPQNGHAGSVGAAETLSVRGLRKSFAETLALTQADVNVPAGSIVALLGPSGCGKTTLLRCVAGLERPDSGEVFVGERLLTGGGTFVPPERRHVGMVFQDWALFPHLSVARNVGFGLPQRERRSANVKVLLELVGLQKLADRAPETLSGGQQQRVALARALAHRPSVILLDEPFSNLDSTLRNQIRLEVKRLLRELGVTTLFVTHDQEEAFVLGDEVAVMFDGAIVQQATPADLYLTPASRAVAEFIGDANFLSGIAKGNHAETLIGSVPLRDELIGSVEVLLRPEQLIVSPGNDAVVEGIEFYGHDAVYLLRMNEGSTLRARVIAAPVFGRGDRVAVSSNGHPAAAFSGSGTKRHADLAHELLPALPDDRPAERADDVALATLPKP